MSMNRTDFLEGVATAQRAADRYYNQDKPETLMSDEAYDLLLDQLRDAAEANDWDEADSLFNDVAAGQASVPGSKEVRHAVPMLSLAKAQESAEVDKFILTINDEIVLEPKLDGIAIAVEYVNGKLVRASTRGNGEVGEDITAKLLSCTLRDLPRVIDFTSQFEIRGELYISYADFELIQAARIKAGEDTFSNPRNPIAGVLRTSNDTSGIPLSFGAYDVLAPALEFDPNDSYLSRLTVAEGLGFTTARSLAPVLSRKLTIAERIEALGQWRKSVRVEANGTIVRDTTFFDAEAGAIPMPTDGIVLKTNSFKVREQLGAASRHPRWALAYKYEAESAPTKLLDIVREIGKTGRVSYVAQLEPVMLDGSKVGKATLNNMDFIRKLGLRLGDTVWIRKANDIIPEIFEVSPVGRGAEPYEAPTTCPYCGKEMDTSSVMWVCGTPACRRVALFVYAFGVKALDADHWARGVIRPLTVKYDIKSIADFYRIGAARMAQTEMTVSKTGASIRIGEGRTENLLASLEEIKQRPLERVLAALSIPSLGATTSKMLVKKYGSLARIQALTQPELAAIHGLAELSATNIHDGLRAQDAVLQDLKGLGFVSLTQAAPVKIAAPTNSAFAGKTYVITGTIEGWKREVLAEKIESLGGHVSGSVSKNTDALIYGEKAGSKLAKATSLGVAALPALDFIATHNL